MAKVAVFGAGYVGLVTGACLADLGHSVVVRDIVPEKIDALRRGKMPIYEPGLDDVIARAGGRLTYTLDVREALAGAEFVFVCVGTPPTYSGDADLAAVWTVVEELGAARPDAIVVMKSTVPVGTGEKVRAALDARGLEGVGYVSNPEFTAEGSAVRDFMRPDRIVIGAFEPARRRRGRGAARRHRRPGRAHRRELGGDGQARLQRVPLDPHQLRQRDRERVRAGRRRRRARGARHGPRPPPRPALPARRRWLRWFVFSERRVRFEAARRQLGLPLPAPLGGDRGQRAAEAARGREARAPPRQAARQEGGAARARVQAQHGRHARGAEHRARRAAARRGSRGARLGPGRTRRRAPARACSSAPRRSRRSRTPTPR